MYYATHSIFNSSSRSCLWYRKAYNSKIYSKSTNQIQLECSANNCKCRIVVRTRYFPQNETVYWKSASLLFATLYQIKRFTAPRAVRPWHNVHVTLYTSSKYSKAHFRTYYIIIVLYLQYNLVKNCRFFMPWTSKYVTFLRYNLLCKFIVW